MIKVRDFVKILNAFDFGRVKIAMDAVDWNYTGDPVTIEELANMAWTLYDGFPDWNINEPCSTSSGGFTICKPHGARYLTLSFNIEEASSQHSEESDDV